MTFKHGLTIGSRYTTYFIQDLFKHNRYRGMRYSKETNTLVLISDHIKSPYEDRWINGILHYNGMGLSGDQSFDFMQNKTLYESNSNGVDIYLFEVFDCSKDKYIFMGQFKLFDTPYYQNQFDNKGQLRKVCVFPLKPLDLDKNSITIREDLLKSSEITKQKIKKIRSLSNEQLKKSALIEPKLAGNRNIIVNHYYRSQYITEFAKRRANGICELCNQPAPFKLEGDIPYLETHHIHWLSKGGEDSIENTVAVCPNCHRKLHYAPSQKDIDKLLEINKFNV